MILELIIATGICAAATYPHRNGNGVDSWGDWPPPLKDEAPSRTVDEPDQEAE